MTRRSRIGTGIGLGLGITALAAVGAFVWPGIWQDREAGYPGTVDSRLVIDPTDQRLVAMGRDVYAAECASCHGANLEGQEDWRRRGPDGRLPAPPHDETGHTWHHSDFQLFQLTRDGVAPYAPPGYQTDMMGFGNRLSDEEIIASLAFIKSRWPAEIRRKQAEITRRNMDQPQR